MLDVSFISRLDYGDGSACTPEEYVFLASLVYLTAPASVLEIGSATGIGAFAMAAAGNTAGRRCSVTTIDIPFGAASFADALARNRQSVDAYRPGVTGFIEFLVGDSRKVLPVLAAEGRTFDLVFIDGDHSAEGIEADWINSLRLKPAIVVLHDTIQLDTVARFVAQVRADYECVTLSYPAHLPCSDRGGTPVCPGFTIFTSIEKNTDARRRYLRKFVATGYEAAQRVAEDGLLSRAQLHEVYGSCAFREELSSGTLSESHETLEIILTGRNDGYGGEDFAERMFVAAEFNHLNLSVAGVPHTYTLVEWNPIPGQPLLSDLVRERLPWWHRCIIVSPGWHQRLSENPRLQFMEFFAKNVGIRRATARWVLTTNTDIFLSKEVVDFLAQAQPIPGTLYRATRIDIDRRVDWRRPDWGTFSDSSNQLRRHEIVPPYFGEGAGDFLLLDRDSYHRLGGFNETIRFSKIDKDGQFCVHCQFHGLPIKPVGPVYHLDHDGSFVNMIRIHGPFWEEAPYGPRWDAFKPYSNRLDWGLTAATEESGDGGATVRLYTPEERGPAISLILMSGEDQDATRACIEQSLGAYQDLEILVLDSSGEASVPEPLRVSDRRIRTIKVGTRPVTMAFNEGLSLARGRLLCCVPVPAYFSNLPAVIDRFNRDPDVDTLTFPHRWVRPDGTDLEEARAVEHRWPEDPDVRKLSPFAVFRRTVYDRLGDFDCLSSTPQFDYYSKIARAFAWGVDNDVEVRVIMSSGAREPRLIQDPSLGEMWARLSVARTHPAADEPLTERSALLPATLLRDYRRKTEDLRAAIATRLRAKLPEGTNEVSMWGLDLLTALVVGVIRTMKIGIRALYTDASGEGHTFAGIRLRGPAEFNTDVDSLVICTSSIPAEIYALHRLVPADRIVHLLEPLAELPVGTTGLVVHVESRYEEVKRLRALGRMVEAEQACRELLGEPWLLNPEPIMCELAEIAVGNGKLAMGLKIHRRLVGTWPERRDHLRSRAHELAGVAATRGHLALAIGTYRWLMCDWRENHALLLYNIASTYKTFGKVRRARRHFEQLLALPDALGERLRGGAHFHLGEIFMRAGDLLSARTHFELALSSIPEHKMARGRLHEVAGLAMGEGRFELAAEIYVQLLRDWPERAHVLHYNLGSLYQRMGNDERARAEFEQLLASADCPDNGVCGGCHTHLGEISLKDGDRETARTHFEQALKFVPEHQKAKERLQELVAGSSPG